MMTDEELRRLAERASSDLSGQAKNDACWDYTQAITPVVLLELLDRVQVLRETLEFYARAGSWCSMSDTFKTFAAVRDVDTQLRSANDMLLRIGGKRAREALAKTKGSGT